MNMKRIVFVLLVFCGMLTGTLNANAGEVDVELTAERIKDGPIATDLDRGPIYVPSTSIDGYTFYINDSHPDYVLQLVDPDDEDVILYQVFVPSSVNSIVLPSYLSGEYVIQLIWDNWRFWGYIELE